MRRLALMCIDKGIVLQAGHTDAAYSNMVEGMALQACTHSSQMYTGVPA